MSSGLDGYLVDHLIELYCAWREECAAVQVAYDRLSEAEPPDRSLAFAAYTAALDREAAAAQVYGDQVSRVSSRVSIMLGPSASGAPAGRGAC